MGAQKRLFACITVLLGICSAFALPETRPALTNAVWSGDQFQFTLQGETNVAYILESSSNLRTWTRALTNAESQATRIVIVPATNSQTLWRVRPVPSPVFQYAILAQGVVDLGGSRRIDSFNSTNTLESTAGQYDPAKTTDRAIVATTSRSPGAIAVGNASIYGSVGTGPGATVLVGNNGNVGSAAYNDNPAYDGTIEPGHHRDDIRALLPTPSLPTDFTPMLVSQNVLYPQIIGGTNYKYAILQDGDYRFLGNLSLGSGEKMLINAKARLHVSGDTTVSSSGYILLGPSASVEWYAFGSVSMSGGGFINESRRARNFSIFVHAASPVTYSGNAPFIGTIYARYAPVTFIGTADVIGAIVCTNFKITGTMDVHFDESLKREGPSL